MTERYALQLQLRHGDDYRVNMDVVKIAKPGGKFIGSDNRRHSQ